MKKKLFTFAIVWMLLPGAQLLAQCAMCRSTLENNLSGQKVDVAAGLNLGILYLFFAPYVVLGVIGFLWYRNSRRNAQKKLVRGHH